MEDTEVEKLNIEERKIIHILLKNLMALKNENAFLKNKAALHSSEESIPENIIGTKDLIIGTPENIIGTTNLIDAIPEKIIGTTNLIDGTREKVIGTTNLIDAIPEKMIGTTNLIDAIPEKMIGTNTISDAVSKLNTDANGGVLIYSVFEKGLLNALEDYIKNGNGQTTLYGFYSDFIKAIEERNSPSSKIQDAAAVRLEDTHFLPAQLSTDRVPISQVLNALQQGHLPRRVKWDLYGTIARELLLLHNAGMATSAELRDFSGLSVTGFRKHLPKLMEYGLVKKQFPLKYVLTDKSNHILLELFGVAKTV